ncbi:RNA 2',3'-cyclic phosphodiesterase [Patescibacteria group bacterium]|nr:RNA 2',3'-cyclic phosphodiesterase [Patescibacteria group bacterium]
MRHRVFIAVNLPENIKRKLTDFQEKWPELPTRWTKLENLHITLIFLGYISDEEVFEICKITKEVVQKNEPFSINLNKICYGPPKKMPPRMVWVKGEKSKKLTKLKNDLENALSASAGSKHRKETRPFSPHITLGRIRQWEFRKIEPEERPEVDIDLSLSFEVFSIEVMESFLKRGGSEYTILESTQLGKPVL